MRLGDRRDPLGVRQGICELISSSDQIAVDPFQGLTAKQCEVLDLLIEHKTSKEISRLLGISPHTVDQRIMLARAKLRASTRSEVAQAYRRLRSETEKSVAFDTYEQSIYGSSQVALLTESGQDGWREGADRTSSEAFPVPLEAMETSPQQRAEFRPDYPPREYYHVLPEAFDGRIGTLMRLGAIAMITVFLTLIILGGLAIYSELSHMLDG